MPASCLFRADGPGNHPRTSNAGKPRDELLPDYADCKWAESATKLSIAAPSGSDPKLIWAQGNFTASANSPGLIAHSF